jgi:hypothetical protein
MHSFPAQRRRNNHGSRSPITGRYSCGNRESPSWRLDRPAGRAAELTLYKSKGFEIGNGNILVRDDKRKLIEGTEKTEADILQLFCGEASMRFP